MAFQTLNNMNLGSKGIDYASGVAAKGKNFNAYGAFDDQLLNRDSATNQLVSAAQDRFERAGESLLPKTAEKKSQENTSLLMCMCLPPLIFTAVYYARAMWIRYEYPGLSLAIIAWFFLLVLFTGAVVLGSCIGKHSTGDSNHVSSLLFFMCSAAFAIALVSGEDTFHQYTETYYDLVRLNSYPSVDPTKWTGQQVMDAGIIEFTPESRVEVQAAMGFKDVNVYCVAPITKKGTSTSGLDDQQEGLPGQNAGTATDFWAVGINCCSGHAGDFHCGEYNSATARTGVRVLNVQQRDYFRLAVKKAEAEYGIKSSNPIFLHWMGTPSDEVNALYDDYIGAFIRHISWFACATLFTVAFATIIFAKL